MIGEYILSWIVRLYQVVMGIWTSHHRICRHEQPVYNNRYIYIQRRPPTQCAYNPPKTTLASPPSADPTLIPPLLPLLPQIIQHPSLTIPPHPLRHIPLRLDPSSRRAIIHTTTTTSIKETLLHSLADSLLLLHPLREPLVQAGRRKRRERMVHVALALSPLALQGARAEELGLGRGALLRQPGLELGCVQG